MDSDSPPAKWINRWQIMIMMCQSIKTHHSFTFLLALSIGWLNRFDWCCWIIKSSSQENSTSCPVWMDMKSLITSQTVRRLVSYWARRPSICHAPLLLYSRLCGFDKAHLTTVRQKQNDNLEKCPVHCEAAWKWQRQTIRLTCLFLDCGRKPDNPERTCVDT